MAKYTDYLNLFEWEPDKDLEEEFDIQKALNDNWDKIDIKLKNFIATVLKELEDSEEALNTKFSDYKDTVDKDIDDFKKNTFATTQMVNGYVSDLFDTTKNYSEGQYCIKDNTLYKANTNITAGEWDSTQWTATTISAELESRLEFEVVEIIEE